MKCPACGNQLEQMTVEGLSVDVCKNGCGGIWFDNFELKQVDEKHESAGEKLLQVEKNPDTVVDYSQKRLCPKCENQKMIKHFMSVKREAEVDECPNCGGFWLDAGELGQIRNQFETEIDRKRAADEYFSEIFGDELANMQAKSAEKLQRARNIAKMFRFICPTYYIPGKQGWGAF
jgi:Zn-finger nucleic acid-binding protein